MGVDIWNVQSPVSVTSKVQPVEFCPQSWSSEGSLDPLGDCVHCPIFGRRTPCWPGPMSELGAAT